MNLLRGMIVHHAVLHKSYMIVGFDSFGSPLVCDRSLDADNLVPVSWRFLTNARDSNGKLIGKVITPCK